MCVRAFDSHRSHFLVTPSFVFTLRFCVFTDKHNCVCCMKANGSSFQSNQQLKPMSNVSAIDTMIHVNGTKSLAILRVQMDSMHFFFNKERNEWRRDVVVWEKWIFWFQLSNLFSGANSCKYSQFDNLKEDFFEIIFHPIRTLNFVWVAVPQCWIKL